MLAVYDAFDGRRHIADFEGCLFTNMLLEAADPADPVTRAGAASLAGIREFLKGLAHAGRSHMSAHRRPNFDRGGR